MKHNEHDSQEKIIYGIKITFRKKINNLSLILILVKFLSITHDIQNLFLPRFFKFFMHK